MPADPLRCSETPGFLEPCRVSSSRCRAAATVAFRPGGAAREEPPSLAVSSPRGRYDANRDWRELPLRCGSALSSSHAGPKCGHAARGHRDKRRHRCAALPSRSLPIPRCSDRCLNRHRQGLEYRVRGDRGKLAIMRVLSNALGCDPVLKTATATAHARTSGEPPAPVLSSGSLP